jgi:hypothetical protein
VTEDRPRGWRRLIGEGRTFVAAMIALVAGVVGLVFQLVPSLKPDPRENVGAAIEIFAVESQVPVSTWAQEAFSGDPGEAYRRALGVRDPDPDQLGYAGTVIYVRVEVDGYKHRTVQLRVALYDARTRQREKGAFGQNVQRRSAVPIDSPNRRSVQLMFVPDLSSQTTREFLRVELVDAESGSILAVTDSPPLVHGRVAA